MNNTTEFDDIRPYRDDEIPAAMQRIVHDPFFSVFASYVYPNTPIDQLKQQLLSISSVYDFQQNVSSAAIWRVVNKSITNFETNGLQNLDKNKSYLFISNHRDIVLDSALLQIYLDKSGFSTSEITFGSNLMYNQFIIDIGKSNKMYKVIRWIPSIQKNDIKQFFNNSMHLSKYIRYSITEKHESSWIAQRNGRAKDGNDVADQGLLKMLSMSGGKDYKASFAELNIVPVAVSYQWETCDVQKVNELFIKKTDNYVKTPKEDLNSIINGIMQPKGNVHLEVLPVITSKVLDQFAGADKNSFIQQLTKYITVQINKNYKLHDTNYIGYDLLNNSMRFSDYYTPSARESFITMMNERLEKLIGEQNALREIYLGIYANPVRNQIDK